MSTEPKMTPWFVNGEKPARPGVYETKDSLYADRPMYQHWNGRFWGYFCLSINAAKNQGDRRSCWEKPQWRGLASKP